MDCVTLCLDVGGTEIKAAPVQNGTLLTPIQYFPAHAHGTFAELSAHFSNVLQTLYQLAPAGSKIDGVHFAFPGPFDYENGVCLIEGLDKYEAFFEKNLRELFFPFCSDFLHSPSQIRFINDAAAFCLGEMHFGGAIGSKKTLAVCIGTGCGSAFGLNGKLAPEGTPHVPPHGYLYPTPFLDGCLDDYLSKRGLVALSLEMLGEPLEGAKLSQLAQSGNELAKACFFKFGQRIAEGLAPHFKQLFPRLFVPWRTSNTKLSVVWPASFRPVPGKKYSAFHYRRYFRTRHSRALHALKSN